MSELARFRLRFRGQDVPLTMGEFVLGRSAKCDLKLDDSLVSRRHAILRVSADKVELEDLGSRNGVLVNGDLVSGRRTLHHGDWVVIASHVLTFQDSELPVKVETGVDPESVVTRKIAVTDENAPTQRKGNTDATDNDITRSGLLHDVLLKACERSLRNGTPQQAEDDVANLFVVMRARLLHGSHVDRVTLDACARFAIEIARKTKSARWLERLLEVYGSAAKVIDQNHLRDFLQLCNEVGSPSSNSVNHYIHKLETRGRELSGEERDRIAQLKPLAAAS